MKKTLQTCFLALLCLYGSPPILSQVADSPRERGGSDSFPNPKNHTAVIWGRVSEYSDRDRIDLEIFPEFYYESTKAPGSNSLRLPLRNGLLMEGAYPKDKSFQYNLESLEKPAWINLSLENSSPILNRFLVEPGDSVQVFVDLESISVVFAGKDSEKFQLQYQLQLLDKKEKAGEKPVLWTDDPQKVLGNPKYQAQLKEASENAGPVLQVKNWNGERLEDLKSFNPYTPDGLIYKKRVLIEEYRGILENRFLDFLKKEAEIQAWATQLFKVYSGISRKDENRDPSLQADFERLAQLQLEESQKALGDEVVPYSAAMMDYLKAYTRIQAFLHQAETFEASHLIPDPYWKQKHQVRLLFENYQHLNSADSLLQATLENATELEFVNKLKTLQNTTKRGVAVQEFRFENESGDTVGLEQLEGAELVLVEFWITGCKACVAFNEQTLSALKERYADNSKVKILTVSADFNADLWKKSLESGKYTQSGFLNLYTGSANRKHPFLQRYGLSSYPNRILLDGEGKILQLSQVPFSQEELIPLIDSYLSTGPENSGH